MRACSLAEGRYVDCVLGNPNMVKMSQGIICEYKGRKTMAKLYFRHGAMGSSKTANALMVAYNYYERGKRRCW